MSRNAQKDASAVHDPATRAGPPCLRRMILPPHKGVGILKPDPDGVPLDYPTLQVGGYPVR